MNLQEEMLKIKNEMIDEFDKRVEALKVDEQEFPQDGDEYWYIGTTGNVYDENWEGFGFEEAALEIGNVFKTKKEADFAAEKLKVEAELRKFGRPFECGAFNCCISLDKDDVCFYLESSRYFQSQGTIYFESKDKAEEAIESVGEERIKKYIFGVED